LRQPQGVSQLQGKARFIRPVIVAAIMAFLMTAVITFINLGMPPDFLRRWMIAYAVAWPFATVAAFIAVPLADRATRWIIGRFDHP
jgi:cell division protein FtsW (lipid II flippase)